MLKSLTTKFLIALSLVGSLPLLLAGWIFLKIQVRDHEAFLLDALLLRLQSSATLPDPSKSFLILKRSGEFSGSLPEGFSKERILSLIPPSGTTSLVTPCRDLTGKNYLCGFHSLEKSQSWAFDLSPKPDAMYFILKMGKELAAIVSILLLVAILVSLVLSYIILRPLRKLVRTAKLVTEGDFNLSELPVHQSDEIGEFARAFQNMIVALREREQNISLQGAKIAHSARLASIGQMGASIAHEVKNPLMSMMGYAKILGAQVTDPQLKEAAEIIQRESDRCSQILSQMLRYSRIDPREKKPYSLDEVVASTITLAKAEGKRSQVELVVTGSAQTPVVGNPSQVQQILLNLIINAIHASKQAQASKPEAKEVRIEVKEYAGSISIAIQDKGLGIPASVRSRIFEPFFSTKEKGEGTGLGLSVAQDLAIEQGGVLRFESKEGQGTTFILELPLSPAAMRS